MSKYENPELTLESREIPSGRITWRSPSNIALVKYWGKYGRQLPSNPSVSLTLREAFTETSLTYGPRETPSTGIDFEFYFEGKLQDAFSERLLRYLASIKDIFPFLAQLKLRVDSRNSFPHSTGIASSASAMSAMALCLCSLEEKLFGDRGGSEAFLRKASFVARLGSGSACRSVYPIAAVWGTHPAIPESNNEYAIDYSGQTHPVFRTFHDDILLVSRRKKAVSSTAGHQLMREHPFAESRFDQATANLQQMVDALQRGDLEKFGTVLELEALTLHGLMMSSSPPFILLAPNSLELIRRIRDFRREQQLPLYFTLDAGPNLHLLYPDEVAARVRPFIREQLRPLCEEGRIIEDRVGQGPVKI